MMNQEQHIACPVCSTNIPFQVTDLINGVKFNCPNSECDATIGLTQESKSIVEDSLNKVTALKNNEPNK